MSSFGGDLFAARQAGDAHADGHGDGLVVEAERARLDEGPHALADAQAVFARALGQDDGELLAAVAGEQLLGADHRLEPAGEVAQHVVAAEVAAVVVDRS